MRKRLLLVAMLGAFLGSAVLTATSEAGRGCTRCKKEGCPQGPCYFDCAGCCYWDPYPYMVCFR